MTGGAHFDVWLVQRNNTIIEVSIASDIFDKYVLMLATGVGTVEGSAFTLHHRLMNVEGFNMVCDSITKLDKLVTDRLKKEARAKLFPLTLIQGGKDVHKS